jgi:sugar-specific transcriptional regulator TrmB
MVEVQFSEEQVLTELGLTSKQARVYLALARSKPLRVMEISKIARVARSDVYSALQKLQQLCIAEKLIKHPSEYKAIPLGKTLSRLLEAKTDDYDRVKSRTELLQSIVKEEVSCTEDQSGDQQFILVSEGKAVIEKIGTAIEEARRSMEVVLSWKRFSHGIADKFAENLEKAWARKVKMRFIVESPPKNGTTEQLIQYFREKPYSKLRFTSDHPNTVFGVYD